MKRWIIGLGLDEDEQGPLELGAWLRETTGAELHALHVCRAPALAGLAEAEVRHGLEALMHERIAATGLGALLESSRIVFSGSPARALLEEACWLDAGLLVGRRAHREATGIVRLGRTVRRLLRWLPRPVGIAAPDLRARDLQRGPIVLALDPSPDSDAAATFARTLATSCGRELAVAHVFDAASEPALRTLPEPLAARTMAALRERAESDLDQAVHRHELGDARLETRTGVAVDELLSIADELNASALVCGSRRISTAERVFGGSVGSALAATSHAPVFVIPPDGGA